MATTISITVGNITESITIQDDAKSAQILSDFHDSMGLSDPGSTVTPRQKLTKILRWFVRTVRDRATDYASTAAMQAAAENQRTEYDWVPGLDPAPAPGPEEEV